MQYSWTNFKNYEKTVFSYYFEDEKTISKFECFYSNVEYSTAVVFPRNFFQLQIIKFIIRIKPHDPSIFIVDVINGSMAEKKLK